MKQDATVFRSQSFIWNDVQRLKNSPWSGTATPVKSGRRVDATFMIVIDANILAAAQVRREGWIAQELRRTDVEGIAPQLLFDDVAVYEAEFSPKPGCIIEMWMQRVAELRSRVRLVSASAIAAVAENALVRAAPFAHADDAS
ncbi:MAG: hypothetical protein ACYDDF_07580 [Thermoplasmatota archaeon]